MEDKIVPMSKELKELLDVVFDGIVVAENVMEGNYFSIFKSSIKLLSDTPAAIENISAIKDEIIALKNSYNRDDLALYISQKFEGFSKNENHKEILNLSFKLVEDLLIMINDAIDLKNLIISA